MTKRRLQDISDDNLEEELSNSDTLSFLSSEIDGISNSVNSDSMEEDIPEPVIIENNVPPAPLTNTIFAEELQTVIIEFLTKSEKYSSTIRTMCAQNKESLEVDYMDLEIFHNNLNTDPETFLRIFDDALSVIVKQHYEQYNLIKPTVHCRLYNLPVIDEIRGLRANHLNKLIRINGVVTRRSGIYSEYAIVKFTCTKCQATFGPFVGKNLKPTSCFECQGNGPFVVNSGETIYKDFQKLMVQEIPGTVPPGSLPRSLDVMLSYEMIDSVKPGDEVEITGVYKNTYSISLNLKNGYPIFSTIVNATSVRKQISKLEMTEEDVKEIKELSANPQIVDLLIDSFAPSIYGHKDIKTSILVSLVGGCQKEKNGMIIRGDINVLLMGDPGTAKSQFLRYVEKVSHRAVLATGQGSSGVGLTASVQKDRATREWTLEGGALVLADKGVCLIDEFDKMNETDRVAIHEAMEQQSISISKAGIVATLHARCSVIAAANPVRGRYNPGLSFSQNINLSEPIVSRFDLLCVVKDTIDEVEDRRISEFILKSHMDEKDNTSKGAPHKIRPELLKKYILYARNEITPSISKMNNAKIANLYSDLRKESLNSGIPITVRHIESIIRVSEAYAKLRLSPYVSKQDFDNAIALTLESFLNAQKLSVAKQLRNKFSKYFETNNDDLMIYILRTMFNEKLEAIGINSVLVDEFRMRCKNHSLTEVDKFISDKRFAEEGFTVKDDRILRVKG